jgi:hypothetical protein
MLLVKFNFFMDSSDCLIFNIQYHLVQLKIEVSISDSHLFLNSYNRALTSSQLFVTDKIRPHGCVATKK